MRSGGRPQRSPSSFSFRPSTAATAPVSCARTHSCRAGSRRPCRTSCLRRSSMKSQRNPRRASSCFSCKTSLCWTQPSPERSKGRRRRETTSMPGLSRMARFFQRRQLRTWKTLALIISSLALTGRRRPLTRRSARDSSTRPSRPTLNMSSSRTSGLS